MRLTSLWGYPLGHPNHPLTLQFGRHHFGINTMVDRPLPMLIQDLRQRWQVGFSCQLDIL